MTDPLRAPRSPDPIREQLARNCEGNPEDTGPAEDALRDYEEMLGRAPMSIDRLLLLWEHRDCPRPCVFREASFVDLLGEALRLRGASREGEPRRDLVGEQTAAEDIRNALQLMESEWFAWGTQDYDAAVRLLRHALQHIEGTK